MKELETFDFQLLEAQVEMMHRQWKIDRLRGLLLGINLDPDDDFYLREDYSKFDDLERE